MVFRDRERQAKCRAKRRENEDNYGELLQKDKQRKADKRSLAKKKMTKEE